LSYWLTAVEENKVGAFGACDQNGSTGVVKKIFESKPKIKKKGWRAQI
jgi:hypothetical protein